MSEQTYKISAVICTYNRDKYLPEALNSFKLQTLKNEYFELIIVDNNSTDNTRDICKNFIIENPFLHVRYCFEPEKGLSSARNRGLAEATAPIISYVDDDAILTPNYLEKMIDFFKDHPGIAGVGGKVIPKYEGGKEPVWLSKYLNGFVGKIDYGSKARQFDDTMKYPAGCNMTYTKEILEQAGGFNNKLTFRSDDKYIFHAITKINRQIWYVPETYVYHIIDSARLEFRNFEKLFLKTGSEERIRIKHEEGQTGVIKMGLRYLFNVCASIVLFVVFTFKGQQEKGKYVFLSQLFTLKGFFAKEVFVR